MVREREEKYQHSQCSKKFSSKYPPLEEHAGNPKVKKKTSPSMICMCVYLYNNEI